MYDLLGRPMGRDVSHATRRITGTNGEHVRSAATMQDRNWFGKLLALGGTLISHEERDWPFLRWAR